MQQSALSALILCNFHVYKWENAYSKDLNAWGIFIIFLRWKKGGGCTSACIYV